MSPGDSGRFDLARVAGKRHFFVPPESIPTEPADWLTGGWPPGEYAFWLELDDGSLARLPFVLGG